MFAFTYNKNTNQLIMVRNDNPVTYNNGKLITIPFNDYDHSPSISMNSLEKIIEKHIADVYNTDVSNLTFNYVDNECVINADTHDAKNPITVFTTSFFFNESLFDTNDNYKPMNISQWINHEISVFKQAFDLHDDIVYKASDKNLNDDCEYPFMFIISDDDAYNILSKYDIIGTGIDNSRES